MQANQADHPSRRSVGLARSARLFRLFLIEQSDPERFYAGVAQDAVSQVERYASLAGATVLDIGGGPGHFTAAFRARGAICYLFEPDLAEMLSVGSAPSDAVLADGCQLPVRDGVADVCFSSNVLEHVTDAVSFVNEMVRTTRAGGII